MTCTYFKALYKYINIHKLYGARIYELNNLRALLDPNNEVSFPEKGPIIIIIHATSDHVKMSITLLPICCITGH